LSSDEFDPFGGITGFTPILLEKRKICPLRKFALRKIVQVSVSKNSPAAGDKGGSMGKYFPNNI